MKTKYLGSILAIISMSFSAVYAQHSPTCAETNKKIKGVIWASVFKIRANEYFGNLIIRPKDVTPEFLISLSQSLMKMKFENVLFIPLIRSPIKNSSNIPRNSGYL